MSIMSTYTTSLPISGPFITGISYEWPMKVDIIAYYVYFEKRGIKVN